jgi:tripartite-type tricarboxylate transporter receptor subunit TctC
MDVMARVVGQQLTERWGQPVIIDNRPGAGGTTAANLVAKARPDGYTLLIGSIATIGVAKAMYPQLPYDPLNDFEAIGLWVTFPLALVVPSSSSMMSLKQLIDYAKTKPGELRYGSQGLGTSAHVFAELMNVKSGIKVVSVPYKGGGPAAADVVAGHIPLGFASASSVAQFLEAGRLIPIGVPSPKRSVVFPNVATFAEVGVQGVELNSWVGVLAPANTPDAIIKQLNAEINAVLSEPEVKTQLQGYGIIAASGSATDFAAEIKRDFDLYGPVTKQAGIKAN